MTLSNSPVYLIDNREIVPAGEAAGRALPPPAEARLGTIAARVLAAHNTGEAVSPLRLRFDSLTSHDITYVGIIQTARASGLSAFPVPYVLTNCHNSLCAVGGTINGDDHAFGLSACRKYGGVYVPPLAAVIHSYNREMMAAPGRMILGSDSHTRYGALGCMGVGEGGGELVKQLLGLPYDFASPPVVLVWLEGEVRPGVGPHDVALALIAATFKAGYVKNKALEFAGPGLAGLSVDYRNGIDVMTTESACWSSIWQTDDAVRAWLAAHGREADYAELRPAPVSYYDLCVRVNLAEVEPMIALPFHPSNAYPIRVFRENADELLSAVEREARDTMGVTLDLCSKLRGGEFYPDQAIIAGCAGGICENVAAAAGILGNEESTPHSPLPLSVYPDSLPTYAALVADGTVTRLLEAGVTVREAFCGPCFGAGDTPANGEMSIRHTTRNFPAREGCKPGEGQAACVALMDARSIAATVANGGRLTGAAEWLAAREQRTGNQGGGSLPPRSEPARPSYREGASVFSATPLSGGSAPATPPLSAPCSLYAPRVADFRGRAEPASPLVFGPNIKDWPAMPPLGETLLVRIVSFITDPVTTTDELIPSGETSSYRSNPLRLAEFTLSRKDPGYVERAKAVVREQGIGSRLPTPAPSAPLSKEAPGLRPASPAPCSLGSAIYARKPGDGSAREQAASCQRVLGGAANFALEYATKRYRSNLINWGILPFLVESEAALTGGAGTALGAWVRVSGIRQGLRSADVEFKAQVYAPSETPPAPDAASRTITVRLGPLTESERDILLAGCLINYYRAA